MSRPLEGHTVVVTRPAAQADRFLGLAREAGADCIPLPALAIEPLAVAPKVAAQVRVTGWDWAVYTSANAVECGLAALGRLPAAARTAAVGRATARALERHGLTVDLRPDSATSEGLLATPQFNAVAGHSVLLVKGEGGRGLLRETLAARGAHLTALAVYRRRPAEPDPSAVERLRRALAPGGSSRLAVVVTSAEVLEALLGIVPRDLAQALAAVPLVAPGERVAGAARRLGWRGEVVIAATAEDEAMLAALRDHAATRPPGPPC